MPIPINHNVPNSVNSVMCLLVKTFCGLQLFKHKYTCNFLTMAPRVCVWVVHVYRIFIPAENKKLTI